MNKLLIVLALLPLFSMVTKEIGIPSLKYDWTHGICRFFGNQPQHSASIGDIKVWYNGEWESSPKSIGTIPTTMLQAIVVWLILPTIRETTS